MPDGSRGFRGGVGGGPVVGPIEPGRLHELDRPGSTAAERRSLLHFPLESMVARFGDSQETLCEHFFASFQVGFSCRGSATAFEPYTRNDPQQSRYTSHLLTLPKIPVTVHLTLII